MWLFKVRLAGKRAGKQFSVCHPMRINCAPSFRRAFTLIEVIVVLVVVSTLAASFVFSSAGSRSADEMDRAVQLIFDDIIMMRSSSISTNKQYRMNFISQTQWVLQYYDSVSSSWVNVSATKTMPSETFLSTASFANAGANLEASSRGIFVLNGASGEPYVTVEHAHSIVTRSIKVAIGGAIEKVVN